MHICIIGLHCVKGERIDVAEADPMRPAVERPALYGSGPFNAQPRLLGS